MSYSPSNRVSSFQFNFACTISPSHRISTFRSAARPRPSPSVRMTIRLSGSLQLLLRHCVYHLASPRIFKFRSAARRRPSPFVLAYDHLSKQESTTFAPSLRVPSRQVTASSRSAPQLVRVPVRPCVRMTIRLSRTLQLSLRPFVRVSA